MFDKIELKDILIVVILGLALFFGDIDVPTKSLIIGVLASAMGVNQLSKKG